MIRHRPLQGKNPDLVGTRHPPNGGEGSQVMYDLPEATPQDTDAVVSVGSGEKKDNKHHTHPPHRPADVGLHPCAGGR